MEYTDHVNMENPMTCGNCDNRAVCFLPAGQCNMWQPIPEPVATAVGGRSYPGYKLWKPEPVATADYHTRAEAQNMADSGLMSGWRLLRMHDAIAKRDDLIRRMAYEMRTYPDLGHFAKYSALISEANELLGVK